MMLLDRLAERAALAHLLDAVRAGQSGVLVVRGEPGVGKTALLDYATELAADLPVARVAGVESEMELAYAGLQQLCAPILDGLERLPSPQRDALGVAFGLRAGEAPDRFLVGLAALSLLSEVAEKRPLLCVIDDAQWLDRASVQAIAFVARRLLAEPVALLLATREPIKEFTRLPELLVEGLGHVEARELLGSVVRGPLDERVRDRIVAETRGNPLALLELPRGLPITKLAPGFGFRVDVPGLPGRVEDSFRRRLEALPAVTQRLLLVAAAEPAGEPLLVWRAAGLLGIGMEAAAAAEADGLLRIGDRVTFRHPLVRSAVYRAALPHERRSAHRALAEATDPESDPDRRAWHRAQAALGPDEDVAGELERSAGRAQARGGPAAAAAFLERAAALTPDPSQRAERVMAAAQAKYQAGAFDAALRLLASAAAAPPDEFQHARADFLRGQIALREQIAFADSGGNDAPALLLKAARQFEPFDARLARDTYLDALAAAMFAGYLALAGGIQGVAEAARAAPRPPQSARAPDLLLDGLALLISEGHQAGAPALKHAVSAFRGADLSREEGLRWLWVACHAAGMLWDYGSWDVLSSRQVEFARDSDAPIALPPAFSMRVGVHLLAGEFIAAASMVAEAESVTEATEFSSAPYGPLALAALRGRETEALELIEASTKNEEGWGGGEGLSYVQWATAVLYNSLGRYQEAMAAAQRTSGNSPALWFGNWAVVEFIEAAQRSGMPERAGAALQRLAETTRASGTDWALGIEARSRALVSDGEPAESLYREAIDCFGRARLCLDLARAHLLYGEWLRRQRRRRDARDQLGRAFELFDLMGATAFANRARIELRATGGHPRAQTVDPREALTAQEALIARLAGAGASNPQIAAQLFISRATVAYHLRKVFVKLGISSRNQLARALPAQQDAALRVMPQG
jgi:DNA-binding CsgD family transcriptional regulator